MKMKEKEKDFKKKKLNKFKFPCNAIFNFSEFPKFENFLSVGQFINITIT